MAVRDEYSVAALDFEAFGVSRVAIRPGIEKERFAAGENELKTAVTEPGNLHGRDYATNRRPDREASDLGA